VVSSKRVYWDSCTYLNYLKGNHPRHPHMLALLKDWEVGNVVLVTSALTIAEVLWVRCEPGQVRQTLPRSREKDILSLFDPKLPAELVLVELNRETAEAARDFIWKRGIKPKDAVHLSSAIEGKCDLFHTSDINLLKLTEQVGGNPILKIVEPTWESQQSMTEILSQVERKQPS